MRVLVRSGKVAWLRRVVMIWVGWWTACAIPAAHGYNAIYVPAYNDLAINLNMRAPYCPGVGLLSGKAPLDTVSQADLERLRQSVRLMMTNHFLLAPEHFNLSSPGEEPFPRGLRYRDGVMVTPSLMEGIGDGQGRFTKIPGTYTRNGQTLYAESFTDAPVLWVHFLELREAISRLRYMLVLPGAHAAWTSNGEANQRQGFANGPTPQDTMATCAVDYASSTPFANNGSPAVITTLSFHGWPYQAAAVRRYAYFQLSELSTGIAHSAWFYVSGNRAAPAPSFEAEFDANGTPCAEGLWRLWSMVDGGRATVMRSAAFGKGDQFPAWCSVPPCWPEERWRGFGVDVVAVMEWSFPDRVPERPVPWDPEDDGLADLGCGCSSCPIETAASWEGLNTKARAIIPLGVSDGLLTGGLRLKSYLTEYEINGCIQQMWSQGTCVAWTAGTDGGDWQFLCVRRPSGAEVVFPVTGAMAGKPVNVARRYRLEKAGNVVKLRFPGASREIVHEFTNNVLVALNARIGRKELRTEATAGNWPGMSGVAEFVGVWRMTQVNSSPLEAIMGYDNGLVRTVEYRYRKGGPTNRVVYYQGSRGFRSLDQYGRITWDTRIVPVTNNVAELWSGISTNNGLRVALKQKRTTWVDGASGERVVQQIDVANEGTPLAASNTMLSGVATFPWGEEEVWRKDGTEAGDAGTTRYDYYTDPADDQNYARLRQVAAADGTWSRFEYDALGRETRLHRGFKNTTAGETNAGRVTESVYAGDPALGVFHMPAADQIETNDGCARLVIERLAGRETSRTYHSYQPDREVTVLCVNPGAAYDDPSNLVTTTRFATNGAFKGRPLSIERPGGALTVFSYSYDAGRKELTTTESSGAGTGGVVSNGLRTVTVSDVAQRTLRVSTVDIASGIECSGLENTLDWLGRVVSASNRVDHTVTLYQQGCCGPEVVRDPDGICSTNTYDELKRLYASERLGVTTFFAYDAQGHTVETRRSAAGQADIVTATTYDEAGREVRRVDARGQVTTISYGVNEAGEPMVTTVHPDGSGMVETSYRDGQPKAVTGTAVRAVCYDYGVDGQGVYTTVYDGPDTNATRWVRTYGDLLGRETRVLQADGYGSERLYDAAGRPECVTDGLTTRLTAYNTKGEAFRSAIDMDGDRVVDLAGPDRVTDSETGYGLFQGKPARWSETRVYDRDGNAGSTVTARQWHSLDGGTSWDVMWGRTSRVEVIRHPESATRQEIRSLADGTRTIAVFTNGLLKSTRWESASGQVQAGRSFGHDVFGRVAWSEETGRGGAMVRTRYGYDAAGAVTDQVVTAGAHTRRTCYEYDAMGRRVRCVLSDGGTVTFGYEPTGELREQAGVRICPVRYEHDEWGRLSAMATFRGATNAAPDLTHWGYDPRRGWLTTKAYADGSSNRFEYRPDGLMTRRVSARGVETLYAYDAGGELTNTVYSDGTPGVAIRRDRLGRPVEIHDAVGIRTNLYGEDGQIAQEVLPGTLPAVVSEYDRLGRRTHLVLRGEDGEATYQVGYQYDEAGKLSGVANGDSLTRYFYGADGSTVTGQVGVAGGTERWRRTTRYDALGRLERVDWVSGEAPPAGYAYEYDAADLRTCCVLPDGSRWTYAYDALGQVVAGSKVAAGGLPVTNTEQTFSYDLIGNRNSAIDGAGRRMTYGVNALNQYTNVNIGEWVRQVTWSGTVFSFDGQGCGGESGLRERNVVCQYDADGNMTYDGRNAYVWDAENRLVMVSNAQFRVVLSYDYLSRRVRKSVFTNTSDASLPVSDVCFVYDGWNPVSEISYRPSEMRTNISWFVWGLDMGGSVQGVGGIGGLVSSYTEGAGSESFRWFMYDGNGNVAGYADAAGTNAATRYEYDPFGNLMAMMGADPAANPWRFSTKYFDEETGLYYYGYRYYCPTLGRWLNRDPIGETGGMNLYGFVGNAPPNAVDALGLYLVAFDGTGNNMTKGTPDSNVERLYRAYRGAARYYPGVGSQWWSTIIGGYTGLGGDARIENAWKDLVSHYRNMSDSEVDADPVDIIGFSRGAALARHFANVVYNRGDPRQYRPEIRQVDAKGRWQTVNEESTGGCPLRIRFLGLFDTVASFGKPGNRIDIGYDFSIPPNVQHVRHAVARDESRDLFPLIRVREGSAFEERVFPGVHSDIGGGYSDHLDIQFGPLLWIWQEGQSVGVPWNRPVEIQNWTPSSGLLTGHESNVTPIKFKFGIVPVGMADHPTATWRPSAPGDQPGGRDWWYQ